jgi:hypothetical protein
MVFKAKKHIPAFKTARKSTNFRLTFIEGVKKSQKK